MLRKDIDKIQIVSILIAGITVAILLDNIPVNNKIQYEDRSVNLALLLIFFYILPTYYNSGFYQYSCI